MLFQWVGHFIMPTEPSPKLEKNDNQSDNHNNSPLDKKVHQENKPALKLSNKKAANLSACFS